MQKVPPVAILNITADQSYQLYVNGEYVSRGPCRGFQSEWSFDRVDVAAHLRVGRNVIAIRAYNPGASNFQYLSQEFAGLPASGSWNQSIFRSDSSWKCRRQGGVRAGTEPTSLQLFPQEHIDLREEDPTWKLPTYDDSEWGGEVAAVPWNSQPWGSLRERDIPLLKETLFSDPIGIGVSDGQCSEGYLETRDITRVRHFIRDKWEAMADHGTTWEVFVAWRRK